LYGGRAINRAFLICHIMENLNDIEVNLFNFIKEGTKKGLFLKCSNAHETFYYLPSTKIQEYYKICRKTANSRLNSLTKKGYLIRDKNEKYSAWYKLNPNKI
jgi:Fic family protein